MPGAFARNYLWPLLGGLATSVLAALQGEVPRILADGLQRGDALELAGTIAAACLGYFLVLLQRHGGSSEPWTQPPR